MNDARTSVAFVHTKSTPGSSDSPGQFSLNSLTKESRMYWSCSYTSSITISKAKEREWSGKSRGFSPLPVRNATPTHILLAQTSHMALSNRKDVGMWNSQERKENGIFVMSVASEITFFKFLKISWNSYYTCFVILYAYIWDMPVSPS